MRERKISEFLPQVRNYYKIDEQGNIFNERMGAYAAQRFRAGTTYKIINLKLNDGSSKTFRVHRLVAMAFLPVNDFSSYEVNHKDGNKENNSVDNLEWCTPSENQRHAFKMGLNSPRRGERSNLSKLTEEKIKKIFSLREEGMTQQRIAEIIGCTRSNVSYILNGKTWQV